MRQVEQNDFGQVSNSIYHVYVIVRRDLSFPQQCVQAIHASIEATKSFPCESTHPHIVLCTVRNEQRLRSAIRKISKHGINFSVFSEPDINNELTAIATEPLQGDIRKVFKDFQLLQGESHGT